MLKMGEIHKVFGRLSLDDRQHVDQLATSSISLISHDHGRQRRDERGITRRELQEAIKYGQKEPAHPGRDGAPRWRYTHKGVVYITDQTSRHEITSWRSDEMPSAGVGPLHAANAGSASGRPCGAHFVLVVDASRSMRRPDVPGHRSRLSAVYSCLSNELLGTLESMQVMTDSLISLIEMRTYPEVIFSHRKADSVAAFMKHRGDECRPAEHGNYIPALSKVRDLLRPEAHSQRQIFILFLSDGAPSDGGKHSELMQLCAAWVKAIGGDLGLDRTSICTIAFGPPEENYEVLKCMSQALPRGKFQKLGLSANLLSSTLSSMASSFSTLLTSLGGGYGRSPYTLRKGISPSSPRQQASEASDVWINRDHGWSIYPR